MNGPLTRLWSVLRGLRGTHWKLAWGPNFQNEALLLALWLQTCSCVCVRVCIHTHICTLMHTQGTFTYVQTYARQTFTCTYIYIHTHIQKCMHTNIFICMLLETGPQGEGHLMMVGPYSRQCVQRDLKL